MIITGKIPRAIPVGGVGVVAPKFGPHRMWHPACFVCRLVWFDLIWFVLDIFALDWLDWLWIGPHRMWHPACFVCRLIWFELIWFGLVWTHLPGCFAQILFGFLQVCPHQLGVFTSVAENGIKWNYFSHCGELLVDLTYCVHQVREVSLIFNKQTYCATIVRCSPPPEIPPTQALYETSHRIFYTVRDTMQSRSNQGDIKCNRELTVIYWQRGRYCGNKKKVSNKK